MNVGVFSIGERTLLTSDFVLTLSSFSSSGSLSFALQPFPSIFILGDACCNQQLPTRILEASIKSLQEAISALAAGAHDITVAPQVLFDMITDPQTDEAVEKFNQDWQKLK